MVQYQTNLKRATERVDQRKASTQLALAFGRYIICVCDFGIPLLGSGLSVDVMRCDHEFDLKNANVSFHSFQKRYKLIKAI